MTSEILFAGFGGQGILFSGKAFAYTGLIANKEVSWLPSYGPEMRGGAANCSVCISDEPIGSPLITTPDYLVAMNIPSFDKFINTVKPGGKAFIDSTMVDEKCERTDIDCYYVPASQLATEHNMSANVILMGKLIKETGLFTFEEIRKGLEKCVPPSKAHLIDKNIEAMKIGYDYE